MGVMAFATALENIENGLRPHRKVTQTYGKKKAGTTRAQQLRQDIFGNDGDDIENQLASLTIDDAQHKSERSHEAELLTGRQRQLRKADIARSSPALPKSKTTPTLITRSFCENARFEKLIDLSSSDAIESFITFGNKMSKLFSIEKVGEGSFAEVFKITSQTPSLISSHQDHDQLLTTSARLGSSENCPYTSIIKVIPILGPDTPSKVHDRCSSVDSVSHETNILKQLDPVHGFARFRGIRLVKGTWPASFLNAFRTFRKQHRKRAINAPPDQDFDSQQVYALVEMDDAGSEISLIKKPSVFQAWDIFWTSVILLANAEDTIEFEHRDLHMSNICVRKSQGNEISAVRRTPGHAASGADKGSRSAEENISKKAESQLDIDSDLLAKMTQTPENLIGLSGLRVTVIDYTVARARLSMIPTADSPSKQPKPRFATAHKLTNSKTNVTEDEDIIFDSIQFTSDPFASNLNDIESHIQNLTYKKTRAIALHEEARNAKSSIMPDMSQAPRKCDKWRTFMPRTNVVWLGYLLRVLIHRARGRTGRLHLLKGKTGKQGNNKIVKQLQEHMWAILLEVSKVINGSDYSDIEGQAHKSADNDSSSNTLECEIDEPTWTLESITALPENSLAILEIAVQAGWLSTEDIQAFRSKLEDECC